MRFSRPFEFGVRLAHCTSSIPDLHCSLFFPFPCLLTFSLVIFLPRIHPSTSDNFWGKFGAKFLNLLISLDEQFAIREPYTNFCKPYF